MVTVAPELRHPLHCPGVSGFVGESHAFNPVWIAPDDVPTVSNRHQSSVTRRHKVTSSKVVAAGGRDGHLLDVPEPGMLESGAVAPAPVVYASWEDEDDEQLRRLSLISGPAAPWCTPTRCQTLHALDLVGEGPTWGMPAGRLASSTLHLLPTGQRVRSFAEDIGARLLILDAAAAAFSGNENDRALVRAFLASWDAWARLNNCTVLLLAHPPKSGDPFSGSTDWLNACRVGITLSRAKVGAEPTKGKDRRRVAWKLELVNQNYAAKAKPFEVSLESEGGLRWRVESPWDETEAEAEPKPDGRRGNAYC